MPNHFLYTLKLVKMQNEKHNSDSNSKNKKKKVFGIIQLKITYDQLEMKRTVFIKIVIAPFVQLSDHSTFTTNFHKLL